MVQGTQFVSEANKHEFHRHQPDCVYGCFWRRDAWDGASFHFAAASLKYMRFCRWSDFGDARHLLRLMTRVISGANSPMKLMPIPMGTWVITPWTPFTCHSELPGVHAVAVTVPTNAPK
jgi:hypothetical protein